MFRHSPLYKVWSIGSLTAPEGAAGEPRTDTRMRVDLHRDLAVERSHARAAESNAQDAQTIVTTNDGRQVAIPYYHLPRVMETSDRQKARELRAVVGYTLKNKRRAR